MVSNVRVLIVDDHDLFLKTIDALLAGEPRIEVVGEARDGVEAVQLAAALGPDVVLMDDDMPRLGGIAATRRLTDLGLRARVIILAANEDLETSHAALRAGASAFLTKSMLASALVPAILNVAGARDSLTADGGADVAGRARVG